MATIVILGAGIGGVPCAYELRKLLGREHRIVLVGKTPRFEFTPSNPWVAVGWRDTEETGVDLAPPLQKHGIDFEPQEAVAIDAAARQVTLANGSDLLGISPYLQQAIIGAVIILAVAVDELRKRKLG